MCPTKCPLVYDPTCGTDRKSYFNLCALQLAACQSNSTVKAAYKGTCGMKIDSFIFFLSLPMAIKGLFWVFLFLHLFYINQLLLFYCTCFFFSLCCLSSFQTVPQLLALVRLALHTPGVLYLMVQPSARASSLAHPPLTSFAGVMGKRTAALVNWRRTLVIVTRLSLSRTKVFANVSETGSHFTWSVNRAFS